MATFTVTTADDSVDGGDGRLSLREAVRAANAAAGADRIVFGDAVEGGTLVLERGQLVVDDDLRLDGGRSDAGTTTIDANGETRLLAVQGPGTGLRLEDLTLTGGNSGETGTPFGTEHDGGGIFLARGNALEVIRSEIVGNATYGEVFQNGVGGGIFAGRGSSLTITDSVVSGNQGRYGGAVHASTGSQVAISRSSLENNSGTGYETGSGGAVFLNSASAEIAASTIAGNGADAGAGIYAAGSRLVVRDSTIEGNVAVDYGGYGSGGGIYGDASSTIVVAGSTVTGNTAADSPYLGAGGGIAIGDYGAERGSLTLRSSIVAGNYTGSFADGEAEADDVGGVVTASDGHNVFGTEVAGAVAGDALNVEPARVFAAIDPVTGGGRLTLGGGPTRTVTLRDAADNPALSGADPTFLGTVDQRGRDRPEPDGTNPDVGAFERDQGSTSTSPSFNNDVLTGTDDGDALLGRAGNDLIRGEGGADFLSGEAGSDTLRGGLEEDGLFGGTGADTLAGDQRADRLTGGVGADRFDIDDGETGLGFNGRDAITDFTRGDDLIDLAGIDADVTAPGDQRFTFIGGRPFTAEAGELRAPTPFGETRVQGDTDGDGRADFALDLEAELTLRGGDFVL